MKRIIVVYNPRSSKHGLVRAQVLDETKKLKGFLVGKYEVVQTDVDDNARKLAKILQDNDLVIAAGGDGTASIGLNGIMLSTAKNLTFAALPYGNFNDMWRMLKVAGIHDIVERFEQNKIRKIYPLEAKIDDELFRYAACYFTIGMFAESTEIFDRPDTRKKLKKGNKGLVFSVFKLAMWYFKNAKNKFLPDEIDLNGKHLNKFRLKKDGRTKKIVGGRVTDVMFVNGKSVARVMRGSDDAFKAEGFLVSGPRLSNIFRLGIFMLKSMFKKIPGSKVNEAKIEFLYPAKFEIQAEGEYKKMIAIKIVVKKSKKAVNVIG